MKRLLFLFLLLFPIAAVSGTLNYPDFNHYFGVDLHLGRLGVKGEKKKNVTAAAPVIPGEGDPLNHKVHSHIVFNAGTMFNDYIGVEVGTSYSKSKFHKRSSTHAKIDFMYVGPVFEYKIHEIEGLSLIGTVAFANFRAKLNDTAIRKESLRLTAGSKYIFENGFGVRAGAVFHQTSKLKIRDYAVSNGVHYMSGIFCTF